MYSCLLFKVKILSYEDLVANVVDGDKGWGRGGNDKI